MPKKRVAEDTPEQILTAKASKKRRVSHGDSVEPEARKAAPATDSVAATPDGKKKGKKDKKEKKKAKAIVSEDEEIADLSGEEAIPTPTSTKKSKKKSLDEDQDTSVVAPTPATEAQLSAKLQAKRDRKNKRRQEREQQIATDLAKAEREVQKKGNKDPEALARLASLRKQHKKAKKDVQKHLATSQNKKANGGVDIDALRAEVRQEVLQELKQQEEARKEKSKLQRQKKRKAAKDGTAAQTDAMDVDAPTESNANDDADEHNDGADNSGKGVQPDGQARGLVHAPGSSKGAKPTSDSLQLAQLDHSMASIDPLRFSESLQKKLQQLQSLEWRLSTAVGGRIAAIDPIFSANEESLIIAYPTSVRVFSVKTALLLRTLDLTDGHVADIALAPNPKHILIASTTGSIEEWNWDSSTKISGHDLERPAVAVSVASDSEASLSRVFIVQKGAGKEKKQFQLCIHDLINETNKTILRTSDKIMAPYVFENGKTVVAAAGKRLTVGILQSDDDASLDEMEYLWHELECPETINCLNAYYVAGSSDVHVAVGTGGPIYLYRNLVSQLQSIAKRKATTRPTVQKLHWHRFPVETVKFSKDGNYLISGGFETVLCKWQLDTGRREDLPHMTAPIEGLVVSPNGASYAVRLGNNSLIILSTLDFEAKFAIAGPALPATFDTINDEQAVKAYPTTLNSQSTLQQLLIATPSSSSLGASTSAVYLQTVDARTGVQLEKQALTRNNVTDRVSDPEGRVIGEPDVTHLAISADGKWLATVETWRPPISDFEFTADNNELTAMSKSRRETYLKIWSRNEDNKTWQLTSRIDSPHGDGPLRTGKVLDLTTDAHGFVTIGSEGEIKLWRQQNRHRNGIPIKAKTGITLTSWHCARTLSAPSPPVVDDATDVLIAASLALAADGTLLLAVLKYRRSTVVRLINHVDGSIIVSRTDLPVDVLVGAAIVSRYLVILSETLTVWDIVRGGLQFSYRLRTSPHSPKTFKTFSHLAAHPSGTFAIAVPNAKGQGSELIIFDPASPEPQAVIELPTLVRALQPDANNGFYVIDALAQIKHLRSPQSSISSLLDFPSLSVSDQAVEVPTQSSSIPLFDLGLNKADETGDEDEATKSGAAKALSQRQDGPRFTQDSLAEVFSARDSTMGDFMKVAALAMRGRVAA